MDMKRDCRRGDIRIEERRAAINLLSTYQHVSHQAAAGSLMPSSTEVIGN
jgi:hypothetical protein